MREGQEHKQRYLSSHRTLMVKMVPGIWLLIAALSARDGQWGVVLFLSLGLVVLLPLLRMDSVALSSDESELIVHRLLWKEAIPLHRIRRVSTDRSGFRFVIVTVTVAAPFGRKIRFIPAAWDWRSAADPVEELRDLARQAGAVLDEPAGPASTRLLSGL